MKKEDKEKILDALHGKKTIKIKVTKEMQKEINSHRKRLGLSEEPIKPEYEMEALFG